MQSGIVFHELAVHEISKPNVPVGLLSKILARPVPHLPGRHLAAAPLKRRPTRTYAASLTSAPGRQALTSSLLYSPSATVPEDAQLPVLLDLGHPRNMDEKYSWGDQIGKGGNASVKIVVSKETGVAFACKCISKTPPPGSSDKKREGHLQSVQREIEVLARLRGTLNVVKLEDVYEDDENVYVIMEHCSGGELCHRIGERHYSERTVASYMRAVFRTLAQCHSHHIIHRDVKPGNFMLLNDKDRSPLKAIDFGLAMPFHPDQLPLDNLGFEGTPWYMAPEVLSSQVTPASDIWSAGVMTAQLLTGRFPFDDWRNPFSPSLSAVWKSILTDQLNFDKPWWQEVSPEAKEFVAWLLKRDPKKRPSAKDVLSHPWLRGNSEERSSGRKLSKTVVQRIQRFAQSSVFKRTMLQNMAAELLASQVACGLGDWGDSSSSASCLALAELVPAAIEDLCRRLQLEKGAADAEAVAAGLQEMGFRLESSEAQRLLEQLGLDQVGTLQKTMFAASQLDWRRLQENHLDMWLDVARQTFDALDKDGDGIITLEQVADVLKHQVPEDELAFALRQVLEEAGQETGPAVLPQGINFDHFLNMLRTNSIDSLDQYDDRYSNGGSSHGPSSVDRLNALLSRTVSDGSVHSRLDGSNHSSHHRQRDASHHSSTDPQDTTMHTRSRKAADASFEATATAAAAAPPPSAHIPIPGSDATALSSSARVPAPSMVAGPQAVSAHMPIPGTASSHASAPLPVPSVPAGHLIHQPVALKFDVDKHHRATATAATAATAAAARSGSKMPMSSKPGLQEKRMHGSNLYRNAVLTR